MNICITGALGHIGSKLIRQLNIKGLKTVHLVDNLATQRYCSLYNLPDDKHYVFHELDIMSPKMEAIIKDSKIVIHLAAVTDAETSAQKQDLVNTVNKQGVEYIARLCATYQSRLFFPSTTSVYGSSDDLVDEDCPDSELKPQSPYAESKRYAEKLLQKMAKEEQLKVVICRLGTIFGYSIGMRFHTAVNKFLYQAVNRLPISVWKTALHQKRPYCDLDDAISAINYFSNRDIFDGQIYNIVTQNYTVNNIIEAIKKYIPEVQIQFVESQIMNQLSYDVDNKKSIKRGIHYTGDLNRSLKEAIGNLKGVNYLVKKTNL